VRVSVLYLILSSIQKKTELNTPSPSSRPHPLRPYALVEALSTLPSVRRLLQTREHQDAHELFLLLTNAISDELAKLDVERRKDKGLGEVLDFHKSVMQQLAVAKEGGTNEYNPMGRWKAKEKTRILSPWEGLSANRRICLKCGWCEGIRYETMGAMDVTLPASVSAIQATAFFRVLNVTSANLGIHST
jgi:ubiquitin carboxyl-terminal hydrolase 1